MDRKVIRAFKTLQTKNALAHLVASMDAHEEKGFVQKSYWGDYAIATCLENKHKALQDMKRAAINASWKKVVSEVMHNQKGFNPDDIHHSAVAKVLKLAVILQGNAFKGTTEEDVDELLDCYSQPLTKT